MSIDKNGWSVTCEIMEDAFERIAYGQPQDPGIITAKIIEAYESSKTEPSDNGWQDIESAPTDGTEFIVCWPRCGNVMQLVCWNRVHNCWRSKGESISVAGAKWKSKPQPPKGDGV